MKENNLQVLDALDRLVETTPEFVPDVVPLEKPNKTEGRPRKGLNVIFAPDLQKAEFPPTQYLVEDILPVGTSLLAGAPKSKKSWMVFDMGLKIAAGETFLGKPTKKVGVLYLALEDTPNRLQERMNKLFGEKPAPALFGAVTEAVNLDNGLLEVLTDHIEAYPETKLIIIDTLQKIRGQPLRGEGPYQQDYREMSMVKQFMDKNHISVLFVHHTRKMKDYGDPFNMISGTTGIMGAADTAFVIAKTTHNAETATLHITGRDVVQSDILISFNKDTCHWELIGDANQLAEQRTWEEYQSSSIVKAIKAILEKAPTKCWEGKATALIEEGKRLFPSDDFPEAQGVGYELRKVKDMLFEYDKIIYEPIVQGTASKKHRFSCAADNEQEAEIEAGGKASLFRRVST